MKIRALERHHNYEELLEYDELSKAMAYGKQCIECCDVIVNFYGLVLIAGEVLGNYSEGRIKFRPTYKYKPGTCDFEEEKKRVPSYTVSSTTSARLCDDFTGCLINYIEFVFRTACCSAASVKETLFVYITTVYRKSLRPTTSLCSASMKSHYDPEEIR